MAYIPVNKATYDWFQKTREIKEKGKVVGMWSQDELIIRLLNMWEAGNLAKNPDKTFPHKDGKFYRSD